jgi:hypothetical protein
MEIIIKREGFDMIAYYDKDGKFEFVTNNGRKMMVEIYQVGDGYEIEENNYIYKMLVCKATYIRIMEVNIFIPKLLIIDAEL